MKVLHLLAQGISLLALLVFVSLFAVIMWETKILLLRIVAGIVALITLLFLAAWFKPKKFK